MPEIPDCLNRRYKALDELIQELSTMTYNESQEGSYEDTSTDDHGIKLMCDFWKILKEDPDCNLTQAVKQRMGLTTDTSVFKPQRITCYMAGKDNSCCSDNDKKKDKDAAIKKIQNMCCKSNSKTDDKCCASGTKTTSGSDVLPLSKVLCNLKEAASFDKKCNARINNLMNTQKELQDQIQHLENREKEGVQLLKQADCMWSCMEDAYKKRVAESLERQNGLLKQLKEVEKSNSKWRKNKKDLESQVNNITKCHKDILDKLAQKSNDIKYMDLEIADFKTRIENNKKEVVAAKKSTCQKKHATDKKIASIAEEVTKLTKTLTTEQKHKYNKETEGNSYVKEARNDLQKICRVLLEKKLENEDLRAEKEALIQEIELIKQTCEQCQDRCNNKQASVGEEIKKINKEIAEFKVRCIKCHQCTDTLDARQFCNDCPRCKLKRECIYETDHCDLDPAMDCVCMTVKQKFLDNVFENMYTVLERQSKTRAGKAVADAIVGCLKNSRNGKLNGETRQIVQDFVLDTVKKNLNLTIIGGAVKTRCELDPETYKQLMLCLKQVTVAKPPKADKGTVAKKESCRRWGGSSECNCPGGPKTCVCTKRAPPALHDPSPRPPVYEKEELPPGEVVACPHKKSTPCGPECYQRESSSVGTEVAAWKPDPCSGSACPFSTNMRAAQCVLGPESLNCMSNNYLSTVPYVSAPLEDMMTCKCGKAPSKPCTCRGDLTSQPRERIIEEVMGRYTDVTPIEKVMSTDECHEDKYLERNASNRCICDKIRFKNIFDDKFISQLRDCSSDFLLIEGTDALLEMLQKKKMSVVETNDTIWTNNTNKTMFVKLFPNPDSPVLKNKDDRDCRVKFILPPQFVPNKVKDKKIAPITNSNSKLNKCTYPDKSDVNEDICKDVKILFKAGVISNNTKENRYASDVEIITMDSLINLLSSKIPREKVETEDVLLEGVLLSSKKRHSLNTFNKTSFKNARDKVLTENNNSRNVAFSAFKTINLQTSIDSFEEIGSQQSLTTFYSCTTTRKDYKNFADYKSTFYCSLIHDYNRFTADKSVKISQGATKVVINKKLNKKCRKVNYKGHAKNRKLIKTESLKEKFKEWHEINAKQLKAGVAKYCDNSTCTTLWEKAIHDGHHGYSLIEKEIHRESYVQYPEKEISRPINAVQDVDLKIGQEKYYINLPEKQIMNQKQSVSSVKVIDKAIKEHENIITNTLSGELVIELDEDTIDVIDKKTAEDPTIIVKLKKTNSGHLTVSFNSKDDTESSGYYRIQVKRTPSGSRLLEVNKDYINMLQSNNLHDETENNIKSAVDNAERRVKHTIRRESSGAHKINTLSPVKTKDISYELRKKYEDKLTIRVKIHKENCTDYEEIEAPVTKTLSGNIGVDLLSCSYAKLTRNERAVFMERSYSGALILNTRLGSNTPNAVMRKTASGGFLLVVNEPIWKSSKPIKSMEKPSDNIFYKFKIKSSNDLIEPPAVLKLTPSNNYVVIPDKEYEHRFIEVIKEIIENDTEYYASISQPDKSKSFIVIDFEEYDEPNAFLVMTTSGGLRIIRKIGSNESMESARKKISECIYDVLDSLPKMAKAKKDPLCTPLLAITPKSISDSNVYEKQKTSYSDTKDFLAESHVILKKTSSGKYAVVLDKESKISFIKHLRSYLQNNSHDKVPVRKTENGDFIIVLNGDQIEKSKYGSLKITQSGNIYVTIDEEVVKNVTIMDTTELMNVDTRSRHIIGKLIHPVNKGVTTTCNALPEKCACDESKCICSELKLDQTGWAVDHSSNDTKSSLFSSHVCRVDWKNTKKNADSRYILCDPNHSIELPFRSDHSNLSINYVQLNKSSPLFGIKQSHENQCKPGMDKMLNHTEQCYYVTETVCPYHLERFNTVSNDFLVISRLDKATEKKYFKTNSDNVDCNKRDVVGDTKSDHWDSLEYLSPQLPEFLRDLKYR